MNLTSSNFNKKEYGNQIIYYRAREVSELLDIPITTLQFWVRMFPQLKPDQNQLGYRRYNSADIETIKRIKFLLREKKMSIEYAKTCLDNYRKYPPKRSIACKSTNDVMRLLSEIKGRTEDAHIIVRIEAVEKYLMKKICD